MLSPTRRSSLPCHFRRLFRLPFALACLAAISPAGAEVTGGASLGTPLTLNVTSTASLTLAVVPVSATTSILAVPQASVSGTAPSPYSASGGPIDYTSPTAGVDLATSAAGVSVDVGVNTVAIGATALTNSASSTVNGGAGSRTTTASAGVTGLNVGFGVISAEIAPLLDDLIVVNTQALSLTTGVITSTSTVDGAGPLDASFSTSVADFTLSLFGVSILSFAPATLVADLQAGNPVDAVINLDEVSITLPEGLTGFNASGQILISNAGAANDGLLSGSASASALTVGFQNINIRAVVGGLITVDTAVNGTLEAANTQAMQIVPEPSAALLVSGALALLVTRRRRQNSL